MATGGGGPTPSASRATDIGNPEPVLGQGEVDACMKTE
jgi:hypothetical protein